MTTETSTGRVAVITGASSGIGEATARVLVAAAERVEEELGGADVLINNAGVMLLAPFTSDQRSEQRRMVEVNLLGAMTATEQFYDATSISADDIAQIIAFAVSRPHGVSLNEILVRPTAQAG